MSFPYLMYSAATSKTAFSSPVSTFKETGPVFDAILLINLIFANVPHAIISSFPLLDPYELKSLSFTPFSLKYLAAGESFAIFPAGEI